MVSNSRSKSALAESAGRLARGEQTWAQLQVAADKTRWRRWRNSFLAVLAFVVAVSIAAYFIASAIVPVVQ